MFINHYFSGYVTNKTVTNQLQFTFGLTDINQKDNVTTVQCSCSIGRTCYSHKPPKAQFRFFAFLSSLNLFFKVNHPRRVSNLSFMYFVGCRWSINVHTKIYLQKTCSILFKAFLMKRTQKEKPTRFCLFLLIADNNNQSSKIR